MTKSCRQCGATVKRAGLCATCRTERRRSQWRQAAATYKAQKAEHAVDEKLRMQDELNELNDNPDGIHHIPVTPLHGRLTPRGPDEGHSTRDAELAARLDQLSDTAGNHPWWREHPDAFEGL